MSSRRRPGAPCDFEEARPGFFIIHNPALGPVLRGEGKRTGDRFVLTSQRGEGLIARLRARGFEVLTLADQVAALPGLPDVAPPGAQIAHTLALNEQVSYFAADPLGWAAAPAAGPNTVLVREGQALRRRRSRGPFTYYRLSGNRHELISEDAALNIAYAHVALTHAPQVALTLIEGVGHILPNLPLPSAHERLLGRVAEHKPSGWIAQPEGIPVVAAILARLGVTLGAQ